MVAGDIKSPLKGCRL